MPRLVRLYIRQVLLGFALGIGFSAALVAFNIANLGHLVDNVDGGWLAFVMLALFNSLVFAGVQFGATIMGMGEKDREK